MISPIYNLHSSSTNFFMVYIFDLPHILENIGENLSATDIHSCALVCHSWSLVFVPLSWTKFILNDRDYVSLLSHPRTRTLFDKRVHTISDISIQAVTLLIPLEDHLKAHPEILLNQLTRICFIGCGMVVDVNNGEPAIPAYTNKFDNSPLLFQLLERNSAHLQDLELWVEDWSEDFVNSLVLALQGMTCLYNIKIKGNLVNSFKFRTICLLLQYYPKTVESLEIDYASAHSWLERWQLLSDSPGDGNYHQWYTSGNGVSHYWSHVEQSNLRKLILPTTPRDRVYPEKNCGILQDFLRTRCAKLQSFTLPLMDADPLQFSRALERCLELRELVFDRIHESMMKIYPAAILACQRLESLVVMGQVFDAREVMNAILSKHASTIKRIKWTGGGGFSGGLDLQVFLRSCPNLERLETTFGDLYSYTDQGAIGGLRIRDEPLPTSQATITVSTPLLDSTNNKDPSTLALDELSPDNLDLSALTIEESSNTTTVVECTASSINSSSSSAHTSTSPTLPPSSYWPCRATLTYLDVSFYPDREISDEKQFRDQIEHAYQKIGQLHELVTLHLGCECRCEGPHLVFCTHSRWDYEHGDPAIIQPPAPLTQAVVEEQLSYFPTSVLLAGAQDGVILDFSLATGLEHLSDLKKLELVNISKIKGHKVGYAELEWMKENWPQLKEFYGTRNKNLQNWIQEHWSGLRV